MPSSFLLTLLVIAAFNRSTDFPTHGKIDQQRRKRLVNQYVNQNTLITETI